MAISKISDILELIDNDFSLNISRVNRNFKLNSTEYKNKTNLLSSFLISKNIKKADKIINIASNCPEWNIVDMAIMQIGGVHIPLYNVISDSKLIKIINEIQPQIIFVKQNFNKVRILQFIEQELIRACEVIGYSIINELSNTVSDKLNEYKKNVFTSDIATIVYTSGNDFNMKAVVLTHKNITSNINEVYNELKFLSNKKALSTLTLSHIFERTINYVFHLLNIEIYYLPINKTIKSVVDIINPQIIITVPIVLENIIKKKTTLNNNLEYILVGGAPLSTSIIDKFENKSIKIIEGYGLTEASPIVSIRKTFDNINGNVGKPLNNIDVKISKIGEVLINADSVFSSYYNKDTSAYFDINGYFKTGDIGYIDNKNIILIGTLKDKFKLSNAFYYSAIEIENYFNKFEFVEHCFVYPKVSDGINILFSIKENKNLIIDEINNYNESKPFIEKIKKYRFTTDVWSIKTNELNIDNSINRRFLLKKYNLFIFS